MKNNIIKVSREGNEKIIFTWLDNKKIELFIKNENDYNKNSFDHLFDFIIDCIQQRKTIEFEIADDINIDSDSRISNIAKGIIDICKKEIKEIENEINDEANND